MEFLPGPLTNTKYTTLDEAALYDERIFVTLDEVRAFIIGVLQPADADMALELPVRAKPKAIAPEERDLFHRRLIICRGISEPDDNQAAELMQELADWVASLLMNVRTAPDSCDTKVEYVYDGSFYGVTVTLEWEDDLKPDPYDEVLAMLDADLPKLLGVTEA